MDLFKKIEKEFDDEVKDIREGESPVIEREGIIHNQRCNRAYKRQIWYQDFTYFSEILKTRYQQHSERSFIDK